MVNAMKSHISMKTLLGTAAILLLVVISGCGSGSVSDSTTVAPVQKRANVKLSTAGTLAQNLSGISISVTLPNGVTPELKSDGSLASSVATATGVAVPGSVSAVYTPAAGAAKGELLILMVGNSAAGFGAGEFLTLKLDVAAGNSLTVADFLLGDFDPVNVLGAHLAAGTLTPSVSALDIK